MPCLPARTAFPRRHACVRSGRAAPAGRQIGRWETVFLVSLDLIQAELAADSAHQGVQVISTIRNGRGYTPHRTGPCRIALASCNDVDMELRDHVAKRRDVELADRDGILRKLAVQGEGCSSVGDHQFPAFFTRLAATCVARGATTRCMGLRGSIGLLSLFVGPKSGREIGSGATT